MSVSPQDSPPIYTEVVSITSVPLLEHPPPPTTAEPSPLYIPTTRPVITDTSRLLIPHEDLAKQRISLTSLGKSSRGKRVNVDIFDDFTGDADGRSRLTSNLSHMSAAQCRICFSASGDVLVNGNTPTLIHPCACDGSIRFCHPECLLQWVRQSGSFICELCKTRYRIRRSGLKSCLQWRMPSTDSIDWIHLVIFFFSVCFIIGSIIWMTWLGLGQRLTPAITADITAVPVRNEERGPGSLGDFMVPAFILYSIIDILFLFIAGMELIFTIAPLVRKWYRMNQKLVIENHTAPSSNTPPRLVNANVIAANPAPDGAPVLNLQASIPCVSADCERDRVLQEHIL